MLPRRTLVSAAALLAFLLPGAPGTAQEAAKVTLAPGFEPAQAAPGDEVTLQVELTVIPGWHVYGSSDPTFPTKLEITNAGGLQAVGTPVVPPGRKHQASGIESSWLEGKATLQQRFRVPAGAPGSVQVQGRVHYMVCTPDRCDPPAKAPFTAALQVTAKEPGSQGARAQEAAVPAPDPAAQAEAKIVVRARVEPDPARPGEEVRLIVEVTVEPGWHVYGSAETTGIPTALELGETSGLVPRGEPDVPPGRRHETEVLVQHELDGTFEIAQVLQVPAAATPSELEVRGAVSHQPCNENMCLDQSRVPFSARLRIEAGEVRALEPRARSGAAGGGTDLLAGSLLALILASIAGGLFALAMPCTYPMIPITFSFFTKQAEARGGRVLPLALVYGIGIVLMFVLIGVAAGKAIGLFAAHPATNAVIGAFFVVFAASLFGMITIRPPSLYSSAYGALLLVLAIVGGWSDFVPPGFPVLVAIYLAWLFAELAGLLRLRASVSLGHLSSRAPALGGYGGVFLMGATLVVTSFTCTAPIVGSLIAGVAKGADLSRVALGMAVFGLTMAAPFVVLSLLPGRVKALPRSGEWMNTLKVTLGFIEVAAALKFFSNAEYVLGWNVLPRELFFGLWAATFALLALYLLGLFGRGPRTLGMTRRAGGLASQTFALYCVYCALGFPADFVMTAFAPPYALADVRDRHVIVKDDYDAALARAKQEGKLLLVNFTGFT